VRAVIVEVEVERWVGAGNRAPVHVKLYRLYRALWKIQPFLKSR
jgi:hypothetical protein